MNTTTNTLNGHTSRVKLFGAHNHVAVQVAPVRPWEYQPNIPSEVRESKAAFRDWSVEPSTQHLFFSGSEGQAWNIRLSKQNPLRRLHAFIADFEPSPLTDDLVTSGRLDSFPFEFKPNWYSRTFSGGVRLVWLLEEPVALDHPKIAAEFMRRAFKELRVEDILPQIDRNAWNDLGKYYDVGQDWRELSDKPISKNTVQYWLVKAWEKVDRRNFDGIDIPLDVIGEEVERRFPGRWEGPFEVGRRGVAFFDPESKNPTAAQVVEKGMLCFSEDHIFWPWVEIFGRQFVDRFQANKIGGAVSEVWQIGTSYYRKAESGLWFPQPKDNFKEWLKVKCAIDTAKRRGEVFSEMDKALVFMQDERRLDGCVPCLYDPRDVVTVNGRKMLNISTVRVIQPASEPQEWGVNFPWIAHFFENRWDSVEQGNYFFLWHKRFFKSALEGRLVKGQTLFIAGKEGRGKTLLGTRIVGDSMGGYYDASNFLNFETHFNKELMHYGLWTIDDGIAAQDPQAHLKFSEMIKRISANSGIEYHPKYVDPVMMDWNGRAIITLNDDINSLRILPNLDVTIQDKIMVLRFSDEQIDFPSRAEIDEIFHRELPFYLRWLIDLNPPPEIIGNERYGGKSFIHETLRERALYSGELGDIADLVYTWIRHCHPDTLHGDTWTGSTTDFMAELSKSDELRPLMAKYSSRALGRKLTIGSQLKNFPIKLVKEHDRRGNVFAIDLKTLSSDLTP